MDQQLQSVAQRTLDLLIRGYQYFVSPLFPSSCRFYPSCSEYARQAIAELGIRRGVPRALRRIARCHPFNPGGYDPVKPEDGGEIG